MYFTPYLIVQGLVKIILVIKFWSLYGNTEQEISQLIKTDKFGFFFALFKRVFYLKILKIWFHLKFHK